MAQPAQTAQKTNSGIAVPLLKFLLIVVALGALSFSVITIDLPNRNYVWLAIEGVVAVLLVLALITSVRRIFR